MSWDLIIKPKDKWYNLQLGEIWRYRDLLMLFVRRDFVSVYKQTILGPIWFFIQPILTTITFTVIFGNLAQVSTDGVPPIIFYLAGITLWSYFADTFTKTSDTFTANAAIFGKVYFPRMITPLSLVVSNLIKLGIQLLLFLGFWFYFLFNGSSIQPNTFALLTPLLIILMGLLGLGFGIIITSMTTKYRDFKFLIGFGIQLMMYATPVVYPLSIAGKYKWLLLLNPMTGIIEIFKYGFLGVGEFSWLYLGYSFGFTVVLLLVGIVVFHKVEKSFIDTV